MPELSHNDFETAAEPAGTDALGTARQVKRHFGEVSDMWLWRRLRDDPTFPRPLVINGRPYWRWSELRIWEGRHREAETSPI